MVDNENQWEDMEYSDDSGDDVGYASDEDVMSNDYSDEEYSDEEYETYEDDDGEYEAAPRKQGNAGGCIIVLLLLLLLVGGAVWFFFMKGGTSAQPAQESQNSSVAQEQVGQPTQSNSADSTTALGDEFFAQAGGNPDEMMSVDFNSPGEATVTTNNGNEEIVATVMDVPAETTPPEAPAEPIEVASNNQESTPEGANVEDLFPSENIAGDGSQENNEIMVAYNKKTRQNPFKPPIRSKDDEYSTTIDGAEFEIIEPPTSSVEDENLTKLLQTQISGILFDEISPSAIVNLNGMDQFVKMGDVISGYKIESITKDKVQINYKNNSYVASVGELFTRGALEKQRAVADLENKFAGRYRNNN